MEAYYDPITTNTTLDPNLASTPTEFYNTTRPEDEFADEVGTVAFVFATLFSALLMTIQVLNGTNHVQ